MFDLEFFQKVSIRGRLAYAVCTCRNAAKALDIKSSLLDDILYHIAQFCNSKELDVWEEIINYYTPCCILDDRVEFDDWKFMTKEDALKLQQFYLSVPEYFSDMLDATIEVGASNIYGGTGEYSSSSLKALKEVIDLATAHKVSMPVQVRFAGYAYGIDDGWGEPFAAPCT